MNPRSTSSPFRSTQTRSPTSSPPNPRIGFPSEGRWNKLEMGSDDYATSATKDNFVIHELEQEK
jgi:hypothetical protein